MKAEDFKLGQKVICNVLGIEKIGTVNSLNPIIVGLEKTGNVKVVFEKKYFYEVEMSNVKPI